MRKIEMTITFDINFVPKGSKGDNIKQKLNGFAEDSFKSTDSVVRSERVSSRRSYSSDGGGIVSEYVLYVSDDVNFNNGEVDPVNDSIWSYLTDIEPRATRHKSKGWALDDVITDNVEHITSTIEEENRVTVDIDERSQYVNQDNPTPEYKNMRTLYPSEFDDAFQCIMEELRTRLELTDENYRMRKSLVDQKPTEWNCEQCGQSNVELHHEIVRNTVKSHFREKLSDLDGFLIDEETGEVYMESTTVTAHISQIVHNEEVLTPLCPDCHRGRH